MRKLFGSRSILILAGIGVLMIFLGGCGWFSRSKAKAPGASAPAESAAPAAAASSPPPPASQPRSAAEPPQVVPPPSVARKAMGGRIADEEMLRGLTQGKTTKAEVRELFGVPKEVVMGPGVETFIYYRDQTSGWISRSTERVEMLTVRFDAKGLLKDFEYRYSGR
jgi:hypothetical protein